MEMWVSSVFTVTVCNVTTRECKPMESAKQWALESSMLNVWGEKDPQKKLRRNNQRGRQKTMSKTSWKRNQDKAFWSTSSLICNRALHHIAVPPAPHYAWALAMAYFGGCEWSRSLKQTCTAHFISCISVVFCKNTFWVAAGWRKMKDLDPTCSLNRSAPSTSQTCE